MEENNNFEQKKEKIEIIDEPKVEVIPKVIKKKYDYWKISTLVLAIALTLSLAFIISIDFGTSGIGKDSASNTVLPFINNYMLQGQAVAQLKEVDDGIKVYSVTSTIDGNEVISYISEDGKFLCPQAIDLEEFEQQIAMMEQQMMTEEEVTPQKLVKADKPNVELFVMSYCPFGLQAEKGIIPAIELLDNAIDFELKFVHYVMQGEKEMEEQLRQHCIMENYPEQFMEYLKCFLNAGDYESCLNEVDNDVIIECAQELKEDYNIKENLPNFPLNAEESLNYGVRGSPTLVINGQIVESGRSPQAYLNTICSTFNEMPEICNTELSAETYSASFGYNLGVETTASC